MFPHKHIPGARENKPAKPAHLQQANDATRAHTEDWEHLQVFDYVSSPYGNGVLIHV